MSIEACFTNIREALSLVLNGLGQPQVRHELGERHLDLLEKYIGEEQGKPAIIWVPRGAKSITYEGDGMRDVTLLKTAPFAYGAHGIKKPLKFAVRDEEIDAYFWAKIFGDVETLVGHFCAAGRVQLSAHGFYPRSTLWSVNVDRQPKSGALCLLKFTVKIPFTFEPQPVVAPTTQDGTGTFVQEITPS